MTSKPLFEHTNNANFPVDRRFVCWLKTNSMSDGDGGKGEELWLQSQEGQELSVGAGPNQQILKMTSEHQTLDPTNKITGMCMCLW